MIFRDRAHGEFELAVKTWRRRGCSTTVENAKSDWIHGIVCLAFPEGEARKQVIFDLVQQFSKMDP